jgi:hypothetical protein
MTITEKEFIACAVLCGLAWLGYFWVRFAQVAEKTEYFLKEEREKKQ